MIPSYTFRLNDKDYTVNSCILQKSYLLIHNGVKVISLNKIEKNGLKVETINTIFEADTYEECLVEILSLKLIVEDEDIAADLKLLETPTVKKETSLVNPLMLLSAININK